ncbi:hypothetical protein NDU88_006095 [Pleurodeles waltl]|uniref:Uncharacterized protein n=1 Tax=Pleurodeles waltl TaxID=8319 RepID=A0AAV7WZS2_PLEWA|nr:hypothetical protein NDU88_006095 [Pleurodeles waltl]
MTTHVTCVTLRARVGVVTDGACPRKTGVNLPEASGLIDDEAPEEIFVNCRISGKVGIDAVGKNMRAVRDNLVDNDNGAVTVFINEEEVVVVGKIFSMAAVLQKV